VSLPIVAVNHPSAKHHFTALTISHNVVSLISQYDNIFMGDGMPRALDGLQVLEFGRWMAGPFCRTIPSDLGADVINGSTAALFWKSCGKSVWQMSGRKSPSQRLTMRVWQE
jgi:hypothetical protein